MTLYSHTTKVDPDSGLPEDYDSLVTAYGTMLYGIAHKMHIPEADIEDSVQEVQLKFWNKNGLDLFDPERGTRFNTFYRRWAGLFLLQERDKSILRNSRFYLDDNIQSENVACEEFEEELLSNAFLISWLERAEMALEAAEHKALVPLLRLCFRAAQSDSRPTTDEITKALGKKISSSTYSNMMKKLRAALEEVGMGMETLYEQTTACA